MKQSIITLAAGLLIVSSISSCTPGGGTTTPTTPTTPTVTPTPTIPISTFNITINGHSYHLSGNINSNPPISITAGTLGGGNNYLISIGASDLTTTVAFSGQLYKTDMSSALGTYYLGYDSSSSGITYPGGQIGTYMTVIDYADGGKVYTNKQGVYANQVSTANVTISNGSEVKGTFILKLSYNNTIHTITGDFDYKK